MRAGRSEQFAPLGSPRDGPPRPVQSQRSAARRAPTLALASLSCRPCPLSLSCTAAYPQRGLVQNHAATLCSVLLARPASGERIQACVPSQLWISLRARLLVYRSDAAAVVLWRPVHAAMQRVTSRSSVRRSCHSHARERAHPCVIGFYMFHLTSPMTLPAANPPLLKRVDSITRTLVNAARRMAWGNVLTSPCVDDLCMQRAEVSKSARSHITTLWT